MGAPRRSLLLCVKRSRVQILASALPRLGVAPLLHQFFAELALSVADDGDTGPLRLAREPGSQMRRSTTRRKARRRRRRDDADQERCRAGHEIQYAGSRCCRCCGTTPSRSTAGRSASRTRTRRSCDAAPPMRTVQVEQEQAYAWARSTILISFPDLRIPRHESRDSSPAAEKLSVGESSEVL
jgi:hypothetical protein